MNLPNFVFSGHLNVRRKKHMFDCSIALLLSYFLKPFRVSLKFLSNKEWVRVAKLFFSFVF